MHFYWFPLLENSFDLFLCSFFCVGVGRTVLASIFDRLDPYFFRRNVERTRSVKEEMDGEVFISPKNRHFSLSR